MMGHLLVNEVQVGIEMWKNDGFFSFIKIIKGSAEEINFFLVVMNDTYYFINNCFRYIN